MRDFQVYFSRYLIQVSFPGVFSWFLIQVSPTGMCSRCAWVPHPGPWSGWPCSTSSAGLTCRGTPAAPSSGAGRPPPPTSPAGAGRAPAHSVALQLHTKEVGCYYSQEAETLQLVHTESSVVLQTGSERFTLLVHTGRSVFPKKSGHDSNYTQEAGYSNYTRGRLITSTQSM